MSPTISDYYRAATDALTTEVDSTPDDRVLGTDLDEWVNYLVEKFGMEEITLDDSRSDQMVETEVERTLRRYDIYTDRMPGAVVRTAAIRVEVPVIPSDTLREIWKHNLSPNMLSLATAYPEFDYDDREGRIHTVVGITPAEVTRELELIKSSIRKYNESIASENPGFRQQVGSIATAKRGRVREKHDTFDDLAAVVGIPLTRKTDVSAVVPTAPKVRAKIAPVMPPASKRRERPILGSTTFAAILDLIDNQCRQFERTPQAFNRLTEEGLRDVVLSSLNAVFEGAAGGETFQGIGKVDIHLRIAQGEVFVSEIKFWGGPASLHEVISQLRGRLTWRDGYGVALVLSRNVGFADVLTAVRDAIPTVEGFVGGAVRERTANHFIAHFTIPSDARRYAEIHVLAYNLHVPDAGRRTVKRR